MISAGLETDSDIAVTTGGLTDIWLGHHDGKQVGIRSFRLYPKRKMREAKKVRTERAREIPFNTSFADPLETGGNMEEVFPPKCCRISGRGHEALSIGTRLRLGRKWQHHAIHCVASRCTSAAFGIGPVAG
jgi:hypothetical protein